MYFYTTESSKMKKQRNMLQMKDLNETIGGKKLMKWRYAIYLIKSSK